MDYTTLETVYIPDAEFAQAIRETPQKEKELVNIDGKMRWIVTVKDGKKTKRVIMRPEIGNK